MPGPHDIVTVNDTSVECACGRTIHGTSIEDARRRHDAHFGVMQARKALEEASRG
jgi:hypothetical protein